MARVKIELPEKFIFETLIDVRISDINYGGHVGNDAILAIAHDARLQFLKSLGYSELDVEGASLIMADSAVIYKGESFFGDTLKIEIGIHDVHKLGFDLVYTITNASNQKLIAQVKTGMICFDYENRKIAALPQKAKDNLIG